MAYHFSIIGSGWRAMYYARIAKALPGLFCLDHILCRRQEKANELLALGLPATCSEELLLKDQPDFVVVSVTKSSIAEVTLHWLSLGMTVLCETPAYLDPAFRPTLKEAGCSKGRLVVAEQYRYYPTLLAKQKLLSTGIIGEPTCINISLAHDYHGISLIRQFLKPQEMTSARVLSYKQSFPVVETLSRYERFTDGHIASKERAFRLYSFTDGKVAFYDFDSDQYRSPIRPNFLKITGEKGELLNDDVYYLDENYHARRGKICTKIEEVKTNDPNPNLETVSIVKQVSFLPDAEDPKGNAPQCLYESLYGSAPLSEDETAIAQLMEFSGKLHLSLESEDEAASSLLTCQEELLEHALEDATLCQMN